MARKEGVRPAAEVTARGPETNDGVKDRRSSLNPTSNQVAARMSKGEREDLQRLVRQREKVLKSAAKQRSIELLADFENQMGSEYSFDQDEVWDKAEQAAEVVVKKTQA
jgi:hypothetical protein